MTLDIEGVLRDHGIRGFGRGAHGLPYMWDACDSFDTRGEWAAHVAAAVREQIAAWLADFPWTETARDDLLAALAAQVAPSRVPGEES